MIEPQVLQADCISAMAEMASGSVDLVVADPPYNLGKAYGNGSDSRTRAEYQEFTQAWLREATRVLKCDGSIYVFMGFRFISHLYEMMEDEFGLRFNSWICWYYTQGIGRTRGFSPRHDDILFFTKSNKFTFNLDAVRVPQKYYRSRNNMRGANPGDVWEFSHVHYCQSNRTAHPTQKPEGLIARIVRASSNAGDLVIDPFAGSGTTLRVCQQLGRRSAGFELSGDYVRLIRDRLRAPFSGFDTVDPRMTRIPHDLNDPQLRDEYAANHRRWFLQDQPAQIQAFDCQLQEQYPAS